MSDVRRGKHFCHCINMRRAANSVSKFYDSYLNQVGLSNNQYALLVDLRRLGKASVTDVAHFTGLDRSTLVRNLKPLLEKGLITNRAEEGRRNKILVLTDEGELHVEKGQELWLKAQRAVESEIGYLKIQQLEEMLAQLIKIGKDGDDTKQSNVV